MITEKDLTIRIKNIVNEQVTPEDQSAFIESLKRKLNGVVYPTDKPIVEKYDALLTHIVDTINEADETEGINVNLIAASL